MVAATLASTGLPPERLELEITESVLLQKNANNLTVLYQLKSLGLSIVLDDFGTGYSSLSYLRMFPFDKIKIDRSFVSELSTRADCAAIVCAVVGLGHGLNIVTTAEGVETEEQLRLLQRRGRQSGAGLPAEPTAAKLRTGLPQVIEGRAGGLDAGLRYPVTSRMDSSVMSVDQSVMSDLEQAILVSSTERRAASLQHVIDLFVARAPDFSEAQIGLFDVVIMRLATAIEVSARAALAERLAPVPNAPPRIIHTLAFDDEIDGRWAGADAIGAAR